MTKSHIMQNPYTLLFGRQPGEYIDRPYEFTKIIESFSYDNPTDQVYMIVGLRGSGKTVFMTEICNELRKDDSWIIIELSTESDMLRDMASFLAGENSLVDAFKAAKINLSFMGLGVEIGDSAPITSYQQAITKMLEVLKKHNKKVLVAIDEVIDNKSMREFASVFQIFMRQELPVCLLMTGLFENIDNLQNEKNLTFLYRAPKILMGPLNTKEISDNYRNTLMINKDDALEMASLTEGYSFAFQVLGYLSWEKKGDFRQIISKYKNYISEYSYDKIWIELSKVDRRIMYGIASVPSGKISEIREFLDISTNEFNPYRKRLLKKGLIDGSTYGYVKLTLPFFDEYILENYEE